MAWHEYSVGLSGSLRKAWASSQLSAAPGSGAFPYAKMWFSWFLKHQLMVTRCHLEQKLWEERFESQQCQASSFKPTGAKEHTVSPQMIALPVGLQRSATFPGQNNCKGQ